MNIKKTIVSGIISFLLIGSYGSSASSVADDIIVGATSKIGHTYSYENEDGKGLVFKLKSPSSRCSYGYFTVAGKYGEDDAAYQVSLAKNEKRSVTVYANPAVEKKPINKAKFCKVVSVVPV